MNENELTLIEKNDSRKHKLKVWLASLGVALFCGLVAGGVFATQSYKKSNALSYDEENQQITISGTELKYSYVHFFDTDLYDSVFLIYENTLYTYSGVSSTEYDKVWLINGCEDYVRFIVNADTWRTENGYDGDDSPYLVINDYCFVSYDDNDLFLNSSLTFDCDGNDDIYNQVLSAIEQDIYDNTPLVLSAYDLNNKTYGYFAEQLSSAGEFEFTNSYVIYDDIRYNFSYLEEEELAFLNDDDYGIYFNLSNYRWSNDYGDTTFTHDLYIYSEFIKENIYAPMDTNGFISILDTIVSILTGGIVGVSTGVGAGVSTLVSDIFVTNNALSVMGAMIVIFAGISLAIGLCRWVMNFLTSLGAKK